MGSFAFGGGEDSNVNWPPRVLFARKCKSLAEGGCIPGVQINFPNCIQHTKHKGFSRFPPIGISSVEMTDGSDFTRLSE